jgi:hypothetical protein
VRTINAAMVEAAPRLDGVLDDPVWAAATPISGFVQKEPHEGQPATQDTEVRVVFNGESLYFGILCRDARPEGIVATELGRDRSLTKDDSISILLDTFHDHRNAFLFTTNPLGARYDARVTEEGRNIDLNWDDKWDVAARTTPEGWVVEIEIPFKTLRSAGGDDQTWGFDVERMVRRDNELSYLQNYRRDFAFLDISKAGHLSGLAKVPDGLTWRLKPFVLGGLSTTREGPRRRTLNESSVGLDAKYRVTSGLTADVTINPDFAQAEVDEQIVNLSRFPLFFPERREFFRESAGLFEFGTALGFAATAGRELIGFFSRRIGLAPTGELIPIVAGGRITGRSGGFDIGFLNMQTDDFRSDVADLHLPASNYTVTRIKRDVFTRSNIGAIVTHRQAADGHRNTMVGIDGNFVAWENLRLRTFLTRTATRRGDGDVVTAAADDDWAGRVGAYWNTDSTLVEAEYLDIGADYNPEVGFVPRRNLQRSLASYGMKKRPAAGPIRQYILRTRIEYMTDQHGRLEDRVLHLPTLDLFFHAGDKVTLDYHWNHQFLPAPFAIFPGIVVPSGTYRGGDFLVIYDASPARRVWGTPLARYRFTHGFHEGTGHQYEFRPQVRLTPRLNVGVTYLLDDIRDLRVTRPDMPGDFVSHSVNARIDYSPTNKLLTTTMLQYNSRDRLQLMQFRVNRIVRLSDNIFLTVNRIRFLGVGRTSWSMLLKTTYSFDR